METLTYKVLLVDDEEEVMDVIEHKIDWEQCGFTVIGRAQNGLKALEIAEALYLTCSYDIFNLQIFLCHIWMGWNCPAD